MNAISNGRKPLVYLHLKSTTMKKNLMPEIKTYLGEIFIVSNMVSNKIYFHQRGSVD